VPNDDLFMGVAPRDRGYVDLAELRRLAIAAADQMRTGGQEWPGMPSRQRLELFLATGPDTVLWLLDRLGEAPDAAA
jgi:hypothetical protein